MLSEIKENNPKSNVVGKVKTVFLSIMLVLAFLPIENSFGGDVGAVLGDSEFGTAV